MKSVVKVFDKWVRNNAPNATLLDRAKLQAAYLAGRRDLQTEQKRRRQFEAQTKRLTSSE